MVPGCQPSALIEAIHYRLPYFSHTSFEGNGSIENVVDDFLRAGGWAAIIMTMAVVLSICTCFYCCCMCCVCCINRREKPLPLKLLLGVVTGAIVVVGIIIMFVAFWAESSLHHAITSESSNIVNLANSSNISDISDTVDIVKTVVLLVEGKRHSVFIGYLVILLFFLLAVLVVVALAPVCKTGIGVIAMIVLMGVVTIFNSMFVASDFAVMVIYADVCIGLFSLDVGVNICEVPKNTTSEVATLAADWASNLNVFCNESINHGFILFILSAILVVLFILTQIFGFAYGASFFGRKPDGLSIRASEVGEQDVWNPATTEDDEPVLTAYGHPYTSEDEVPLMGVVED